MTLYTALASVHFSPRPGVLVLPLYAGRPINHAKTPNSCPNSWYRMGSPVRVAMVTCCVAKVHFEWLKTQRQQRGAAGRCVILRLDLYRSGSKYLHGLPEWISFAPMTSLKGFIMTNTSTTQTSTLLVGLLLHSSEALSSSRVRALNSQHRYWKHVNCTQPASRVAGQVCVYLRDDQP